MRLTRGSCYPAPHQTRRSDPAALYRALKNFSEAPAFAVSPPVKRAMPRPSLAGPASSTYACSFIAPLQAESEEAQISTKQLLHDFEAAGEMYSCPLWKQHR